MDNCIIKYVLNKYGGVPCLYNNQLILFFEDFYYDDYCYCAFDLTQLYLDYLNLKDKTILDNPNYFFNVDIENLTFIKNEYTQIMELLSNIVNIKEECK